MDPSKSREAVHAQKSAILNTVQEKLKRGSVEGLRDKEARIWEPDLSGKYVKRTTPADAFNHLHANENYNPYYHRKSKSPISKFTCLMHILKAILGRGIFHLPKAFYQSGMVVAVFGTVAIGSLISHGINLLVKSQYKLCKRKRVGYLSYGQSMQHAMEEGPYWMIRFAKSSRIVVNIFVCFSQSARCWGYCWAICECVKNVIDHVYFCDMFPLRILMCICFPAFLMITYVPNLKALTPFSVFANALMYVCISWISVFALKQEYSPEPRNWAGNPPEYIFLLITGLDAMGAAIVLSTIERHMAAPQEFVGFFGIMNLSMFIIITTNMWVGFFGYWVYGKDAPENLLNVLPSNTTIFQGVNIAYAILLLANYRLFSFAVIDVIWDEFLASKDAYMSTQTQKRYLYATLTIFTLLILILGMIPPDYIDYFTTVCMLIEISMLLLGFPALMELCVLWPDDFGRYSWIFYKDLAMFTCAVLLLGVGSYVMIHKHMQSTSGECGTNNSTII